MDRKLSRRRLSAIVCVLAAVVAASALWACGSRAGGSKDAEAARTAADGVLSRLGSSDGDAEELLGDAASSLDELQVSGRDFLKAFFDGYSYEVGEASVEGKAATVHVKLRCRRLSDVAGPFGDSYTEKALESPNHTPDESDLYALAGQALLESVRAAEPSESEVDLTFALQDGTWALDDAGASALSSVILGS